MEIITLKIQNMKNIKNILMAGSLVALAACRPEYPKPQVNQSSLAPLPRTTANNARIMVFNALVDLNPDENNPQSRFQVVVDDTPLTNFDGTPAVVWSRQFTLNGTITTPLIRKYPSNVANPIGIPTMPEQSSQYLPVASAGFTAGQTAFTNYVQATAATILNGVETSPAVQERGIFIPAGRRNITFHDAENTPLTALRVNANLNGGSITSIFLRGRLGTTSGTDQQGVTTITEAIPSPSTGNAAIRFINLAADLGAVQLLTADASGPGIYNVSRRPLLSYPNPPANTRFTLDQGKTVAQRDSLRFTRDSLFSRRGYNSLSVTVTAAANPQIAIESDPAGVPIPNYSNTLNFATYSNVPAGNYLFNFYNVNRRHLAGILSKNVPFNFVSGGVYTIVLHGTAQTGYKCDIIRMN